VPKRKSVIVQRYLANPLLVNGSKFDLRVYAYVTSFDPLQIYVCRFVGVPGAGAEVVHCFGSVILARYRFSLATCLSLHTILQQ
jgi:hypothetical protein